MKRIIAAVVLALLTPVALGDIIHLKGGGKMDCLVIQDRPESVAVLYGSGLFRVSKSLVDRVEKTQPLSAPQDAKQKPADLPNWLSVLRTFASEPWSAELTQVPATVIDDGVRKNVPYKSQRCGQYEFNVYGDPDKPSGFELGVYGYRVHDDNTKRECIAAVEKLLKDTDLRSALRSLDLTGESKTVRGVTVEITPSTAKDAYGGWWVSVYNEDSLDKSRASAAELDAISAPMKPTPQAETKRAPEPQKTKPAIDKEKDNSEVPPPAVVVVDWTTSDMRNARPASDQSSGRVYVKGYYRKDGTYVSGHTRGKPRK